MLTISFLKFLKKLGGGVDATRGEANGSNPTPFSRFLKVLKNGSLETHIRSKGSDTKFKKNAKSAKFTRCLLFCTGLTNMLNKGKQQSILEAPTGHRANLMFEALSPVAPPGADNVTTLAQAELIVAEAIGSRDRSAFDARLVDAELCPDETREVVSFATFTPEQPLADGDANEPCLLPNKAGHAVDNEPELPWKEELGLDQQAFSLLQGCCPQKRLSLTCSQCHKPDKKVVHVQNLDQVRKECVNKFIHLNPGATKNAATMAGDRAFMCLAKRIKDEKDGTKPELQLGLRGVCDDRGCRMAAGLLTAEDELKWHQGGKKPHLDANVRWGWVEAGLTDTLERIRSVWHKLGKETVQACVDDLIHHSFWMLDKEKKNVTTASILTENNEAFGLNLPKGYLSEFCEVMRSAPMTHLRLAMTRHISDDTNMTETAWLYTMKNTIMKKAMPDPMVFAMVLI